MWGSVFSQHVSFPHETALPSPQSTKNLFKKHCNKVRMPTYWPCFQSRAGFTGIGKISVPNDFNIWARQSKPYLVLWPLLCFVSSEWVLQAIASPQPADRGHTGRRLVMNLWSVWLFDAFSLILSTEDCLPALIPLDTRGNKWHNTSDFTKQQQWRKVMVTRQQSW